MASCFPNPRIRRLGPCIYLSLSGEIEFSTPNKDFCVQLFLHNLMSMEDFLL